MANEFSLNDRQWLAIEPLLPRNQPGARRVDDRRVISGIVHVLKVGCRWEDCPALLRAIDDSITMGSTDGLAVGFGSACSTPW